MNKKRIFQIIFVHLNFVVIDFLDFIVVYMVCIKYSSSYECNTDMDFDTFV